MTEKTLKCVMMIGTAIIVVALLSILIFMCLKNNEKPQETTFEVKYLSDTGGYIEGESTQIVKDSEDASAVTAVAYEGYEFLGWSDGCEEATRQDVKVERYVTKQLLKILESPKNIDKVLEEYNQFASEHNDIQAIIEKCQSRVKELENQTSNLISIMARLFQ